MQQFFDKKHTNAYFYRKYVITDIYFFWYFCTVTRSLTLVRHIYFLRYNIVRHLGYRGWRENQTISLSPVHTSNNVEATLSNAASRTILSIKSNVAVASTLLPFLATMSNEFFVKFRPFHKVETNWTCQSRGAGKIFTVLQCKQSDA